MNCKTATAFLLLIAALIAFSGCIIQPPQCGDNVCEQGIEDNPSLPTYCPQDCQQTKYCGDGTCNNGETPESCPQDCPTTQYHSECQSQQCVQVEGSGQNQCGNDNDCSSLSICGDQNGNYCNSYDNGELCDGSWLNARDTQSCCSGDCYSACSNSGSNSSSLEAENVLTVFKRTSANTLLPNSGVEKQTIKVKNAQPVIFSQETGKIETLAEKAKNARVIDASQSNYIIELDLDPLEKFINSKGFSGKNFAELASQLGVQKQLILVQKQSVLSQISAIFPGARKISDFSWSFNGFAVKLPNGQSIARIKNIPGVKAVYTDEKVEALLDYTVPLIGADTVWQLPAPNGGNLTGKDIKVGIIDTGIDYTHSDFGSCSSIGGSCRIAGGYDFVNNDNDPMDDMGHGTHVAGIIGANGIANGTPFKGVAPESKLYALKVLNSAGYGSYSGIILAIDWAIDPNNDGNPSDHLDVINLSLGGSGDPDDPISQAIDNAANAGIVSVIAAGNDGGFLSIGSPGTARKAITVGATFKKDYSEELWSDSNPQVDEITPFSSKGPVIWKDKMILKPDVVAPGALICATRYDSVDFTTHNPIYTTCLDNKHVLLAGTSMATPVTAGSVALIKQAHPDWNAEMIKNSLILSGKSAITTPGTWNLIPYSTEMQAGGGRIQPLEAINARIFVSPMPIDLGIYEINSARPSGNFKMKNISPVEQRIIVRPEGPFFTTFDGSSSKELCIQPGEEKTVNFSIAGDVNNLSQKAGMFAGSISISSSNNCTSPTGEKQYSVPFSFARGKRLHVDLSLRQESQDQNFAFVDLQVVGVDSNGDLVGVAPFQSFVVQNLQDHALLSTDFQVFSDLDKFDLIVSNMSFKGIENNDGIWLDKSLTYYYMVAGTTIAGTSGSISLDEASTIETKDNGSEIISANSLDAYDTSLSTITFGWSISDSGACSQMLNNFKTRYYSASPNFTNYYFDKKINAKEKFRNFEFTRKIATLNYFYLLPFNGELNSVPQSSLRQSTIQIPNEIINVNNNNFGVNTYGQAWVNPPAGMGFMVTTLPRIDLPRTIQLLSEESQGKGVMAAAGSWTWNYAPGWSGTPSDNHYSITSWDGTNNFMRTGALPRILQFWSNPLRAEIKNPYYSSVIYGEVFDASDYFEISLYDSAKGYLKITKPDGTVVQQNGLLANYVGWQISCGLGSYPQWLSDAELEQCIDGVYAFEWNLDNSFRSQPSFSKTLTASWNNSENKWTIPQTSQQNYCGPGSVVGSIKGYYSLYRDENWIVTNGWRGYIDWSDVTLMEQILAGNSPMPENICCIDADGDGIFTQNDITLVQNFVNQSGDYGKTNQLCAQ
ncbi:MAG: S8 family serine peptidase [Candidatus Diapherotrites archaeon]|nr:S8 family serine peptidase [Candidatus Diapherotrites archaeon]